MAAPSPTPVSRRTRKKERTRRQIYDAAIDLFRLRGVDGVTVDAICEAADVAKGTFFLHFPTKGALLFEYSRRLAADLAGRRPSLAGDGAGGAQDAVGAARELRWLTRELVDHWLHHADLTGRMLEELLREPEALARAPEEGSALADLIADIVRRGQAAGELRDGIAPELAAAVFLSSSLAFLSGALRTQPPLAPEAVRDQFLELLLGGLVSGSKERS